MQFVDLFSELTGSIPRLPPLHAQQLVNRAWGRVRDSRLWSFSVVTDAQLFIPAPVVAGTMTTQFGITTMQADATAKAALNAVALGNPPLAYPTPGVGYQVRIGSLNTGVASPIGPTYTITNYDSTTGILTLDRPYGEVGGSGLQYLAYRALFSPPNNPNTSPMSPDAGFFGYFSIRNIASGYNISGKKLRYTQEQLNRIDPQRGAFGEAYVVAYWGRNAEGRAVHELYPHPTFSSTYLACYLSRWPEATPAQNLPSVPYALDSLIAYKAKSLAGQWALANVANFKELQMTNWVAYIQSQDAEYKSQLIQCIKQDDEINPLVPWIQDGKFDFPLGGQFLQSHDVSSLVP